MKKDDFFEELLRKVAWEIVQAQSFEEVKEILERPGLQQHIPQIREYAEEYRRTLDTSGGEGKAAHIQKLETDISALRREIEEMKRVGKIVSSVFSWAFNILSLLLSVVGLAYTILTSEHFEVLKIYIQQYLVELIKRIK